MYQLYLDTLPDFSMRKGFIHRKKVGGYSDDALRAFASSMFHSSYQIARLKHSLEMNELVDVVEEQAQAAKDTVDAMTIANELRRRHEWVMNPKGSRVAQTITSAAFTYQLGITPAAAMVNTTQTFMLGVPVLGVECSNHSVPTNKIEGLDQYGLAPFYLSRVFAPLFTPPNLLLCCRAWFSSLALGVLI